jgi:hypothetical protein
MSYCLEAQTYPATLASRKGLGMERGGGIVAEARAILTSICLRS